MRILLMGLFILIGCTHERGSVSRGNDTAVDTMADGNIQAIAVKKREQQNICFDITLTMKNVDQYEAQASNWTLAWIDQTSKYHLLNLTARDPASSPSGNYEEWTNSFKTCAPKSVLKNVHVLIMTPKELSYKETEGMRLEWK